MRLIDADALSKSICSNDCDNCKSNHRWLSCKVSIDLIDVQGFIEDAPTVDPVKPLLDWLISTRDHLNRVGDPDFHVYDDVIFHVTEANK